jgi:hypothetical protein
VDRRVTVLGRCTCAFGQLWHLRVFYDRNIRSWLASVGLLVVLGCSAWMNETRLWARINARRLGS